MQEGIPAMLRALPIVLLIGLSGCVYNPHENLAPDFGEAVQGNIASQVVNPVPLQPSGPTRNNGVRMSSAYERYQTNRMYRPQAPASMQAPTGGVAPASGGGTPPEGGDSAAGGSAGGGAGGNTSPY